MTPIECTTQFLGFGIEVEVHLLVGVRIGLPRICISGNRKDQTAEACGPGDRIRESVFWSHGLPLSVQ